MPGAEKPKPEVDQKTLLSTDDAQVWAEEFVRCFRGQVVGDSVDEGLMVGWFAGICETSKVLQRKGKKRKKK